MCGRFAVTTDPALLAQKIQALDESAGSAPSAASAEAGKDAKDANGSAANYSAANSSAANYNVAPTTTISTVVKRHSEPGLVAAGPLARGTTPLAEPGGDESTRRVRSMRWGLVPPWVKAGDDGTPDSKGPLLINARAEKVTESPAFRGSAKNKRCLIPMDGWYEWRGQKGNKTPFYMHATDGELLFMAGLWSTWRPKDASRDTPPLLSCTIITTDAVGPLAEIHDRMPLTISAGDWDRWMDPDAPIDQGLLRGHGDLDRIAIREVSTLVNSVRNNGPELIEAAPPQPEQTTLL